MLCAEQGNNVDNYKCLTTIAENIKFSTAFEKYLGELVQTYL